MTLSIHRLTGLGASCLLIGSLLATGCGQQNAAMGAWGARAGATRVSAAGAYIQALKPRPARGPMPARIMQLAGERPVALPMQRTEDDEEPADAPKEDPAPAPAPAAGGAPLPSPTATPAPAKRGGARAPDDIDDLLDALQNYGYRGDRKQMIKSIHDVVWKYPVNDPKNSPGGWDPTLAFGPEVHYEWWKRTLRPDETPTFPDYMQQSLLVAQNKFNVVYYVWVSKQEDPEHNPPQGNAPWGNSSPWVDFNKTIPIVKGIGRDPWLVEINPRGMIADFLRMPPDFIDPLDYNHLLRIPPALLY